MFTLPCPHHGGQNSIERNEEITSLSTYMYSTVGYNIVAPEQCRSNSSSSSSSHAQLTLDRLHLWHLYSRFP